MPPPSRFALVKRSIWQVVRAGAGREPVGTENYALQEGPRFHGAATGAASPAEGGLLRVVSFNIDHGREVERAVALFQREARLRDADLVLLQEMEETGTAQIAEALGMSYVYYPAGRHPLSARHFGNAILARGAIVRDDKHLLPHLGRVRGTRRIAVGATVAFGERLVTAFSVHLATVLDASLAAQRDQLLAVLDVAEPLDTPVLVGGDFNRRALGLVAEHRGYRWLTRDAGPTLGPFAVDHIVARGFDTETPTASGVVRDTGGASDHRPVWATLKLGA